MKDFYLTRNDQFGPDGPRAGAYGVAHETGKRVINDEVWYFCWFEGFKGYYFVPEYMMEWTVK